MTVQTDCRFFNGYKPCGKSDHCDELCPKKDIIQTKVLVVHLGAIGAVVRSTAFLSEIKRKHPKSLLVFVTDKPSDQLLKNHPLVDRIYTTETKDLLSLSNYSFEIAYVVDKSPVASGIVRSLNVDLILGFYADSNGAILPANKGAEDLWCIGLSDKLKFHINKRSELDLVFQALELNYTRNEYNLPLNQEEKRLRDLRRKNWLGKSNIIVGFNTGCSHVIPYKKLSLERHIEIINQLKMYKGVSIVLLGGPEDEKRNIEIANKTGAIFSPCNNGLRDGLVSVAACDIVVSGDSLGMHMAISQKKWLVAWFGPTCAHEIELYERGEKILSPVSCSPCWKRKCDKEVMCYDMVSSKVILDAIHRGISTILKSSDLIAINK